MRLVGLDVRWGNFLTIRIRSKPPYIKIVSAHKALQVSQRLPSFVSMHLSLMLGLKDEDGFLKPPESALLSFRSFQLWLYDVEAEAKRLRLPTRRVGKWERCPLVVL